MTRAAVSALVAVGLLVLGAVTGAQTLDRDVAQALRVEWRPLDERPGIEGYVYNDSAYRIGLVELRVTSRDAGDHPSTSSRAWVYGNVPARGRTYFRVRVPPPARVVEVGIESFRLIAREPQPESP